MKRTTLMVRVGKAARKRRVALGIQQETIAAELGMDVTSYRAIENGTRGLSIGTLQRLCAVLKIQMWELVREAEE